MGTLQTVTPGGSVIASPSRMRTFFSALRYLGGKALSILITIAVGVFLTILIVNYPPNLDGTPGGSPFEARLEGAIYEAVEESIEIGIISLDAQGVPNQREVGALVAKLRKDAGLDLPHLPRYLLWTYKALRFDWGELNSALVPYETSQRLSDKLASNVVFQFLPNTLLLVGTAYLIVFLVGMPFSLYLARHYGSWLDRFMSVLSPISSVPSWVFAILLVTIFAVQLRWLPVSDMFSPFRPTEPIPYVLDLIKHMILPVSALVLSLLFQLIYTWRTFLVIYSEEDYVDLARAKGLESRLLEKQYILRPALPYIITSFATSLIGFWQLTVALEKIFHWPGLGMLYISTLPSYWGETVSYGDLMIVVQIVVTFSYLLGVLVFILDIAYVLLDPRIHLIPKSNMAQASAQRRLRRVQRQSFIVWMKDWSAKRTKPAASPAKRRVSSPGQLLRNAKESWREIREQIRLFAHQLRLYPSAIFGLVVITLLLAGSLYAVLFLPYNQIGVDFEQDWLTGRNLTPRTAVPAWVNIFNYPRYLSTLILDEQSREANTSTHILDNGWVEKTITFQFDYSYKEMPSDLFLYIDTDYSEKLPFVSLEWKTPDGRTIEMKSKAVSGVSLYDLKAGLPIRRLLMENPEWKDWFVEGGSFPTPPHKLLFANPNTLEPELQRGPYELKVTSLLFEEQADVQPHLVMLGQVYGMSGTDYWRRDLTVPLLWGMPFALLIGFLGTALTALVALLLPAIGVWFGGWLDNFIQRLTELNMVLPGLAIAVLFYALFYVNIWTILAIVVVLNALGAPIKTFRSALLQAKEAPYIEMARSYGASNARIIARYLVPRILPVMIPYLVLQIPTFIFLEATLGFFNIRSYHPSWGKIIYEGLSEGALYGSSFWVLQPIFLLLLTGLAFAMLGSALERILNPRMISDMPATSNQPKQEAGGRKRFQGLFTISKWKVIAGLLVALIAIAVFTPVVEGKSLASVFMSYFDLSQKPSPKNPSSPTPDISQAIIPPAVTDSPAPSTEPTFTPEPSQTPSSTVPATATLMLQEASQTPVPTYHRPKTYTLQKGEYPYCIARRFDVDPGELLALNGISDRESFFTGTVLQIPQSGKPFPGERMQEFHPVTYTVSRPDETFYTIACRFGDVEPLAIAQDNDIPLNTNLSVGQQLNIP